MLISFFQKCVAGISYASADVQVELRDRPTRSLSTSATGQNGAYSFNLIRSVLVFRETELAPA